MVVSHFVNAGWNYRFFLEYLTLTIILSKHYISVSRLNWPYAENFNLNLEPRGTVCAALQRCTLLWNIRILLSRKHRGVLGNQNPTPAPSICYTPVIWNLNLWPQWIMGRNKNSTQSCEICKMPTLLFLSNRLYSQDVMLCVTPY